MIIYQLVLLVFISSFNIIVSRITVETLNGKLRGLRTVTREGRDIFTFYSIRYAEPPTGEHRFKPPIPAKSWKGIQAAKKPGVACMQPDPPASMMVSEDCLFLDIYTTDLSGSQPVIVFLHGGQFIKGSKSEVSPDYLLDKDVVLVSINYRLGPFGFFTSSLSGNQGFKDQSLALKWIRKNIKFFGGNPELITLCGDGSGGYSVNLHIVSPMSQGLFNRSILMSGSRMEHLFSETDYSSSYIHRESSCKDLNGEEAVECLQGLSAEKILDIASNISSILPWSFSVENTDADQPFLVENPLLSYVGNRVRPMPFMVGRTVDDYLEEAMTLFRTKPELIEKLNENFKKNAPNILLYRRNENKDHISEGIDSYYLHNETITDNNLNDFATMLTDIFVGLGDYRFMRAGKNLDNTSKVYYYRFDYKGRYSHYSNEKGMPLGVVQGDDLQYIFVSKDMAPVLQKDDPQNFMIERMTSWWSEFARTGDPNDPTNEYTNTVNWKPCVRKQTYSMLINETLALKSGRFNTKSIDLLQSLYQSRLENKS